MRQDMAVLTSSESEEWYTPKQYIDLVREVMGDIDLDPASCTYANRWIKAKRILTIADPNALEQEWYGKIFLNPPYGSKPYGKSNQMIWSQKLIKEYESGRVKEAILLINSTHGYKWYEDLWTAYPVCCVRDRIEFIDHTGHTRGAAKRGQTFVYFGLRPTKFQEVFQSIGRVIMPNGYW